MKEAHPTVVDKSTQPVAAAGSRRWDQRQHPSPTKQPPRPQGSLQGSRRVGGTHPHGHRSQEPVVGPSPTPYGRGLRQCRPPLGTSPGTGNPSGKTGSRTLHGAPPLREQSGAPAQRAPLRIRGSQPSASRNMVQAAGRKQAPVGTAQGNRPHSKTGSRPQSGAPHHGRRGGHLPPVRCTKPTVPPTACHSRGPSQDSISAQRRIHHTLGGNRIGAQSHDHVMVPHASEARPTPRALGTLPARRGPFAVGRKVRVVSPDEPQPPGTGAKPWWRSSHSILAALVVIGHNTIQVVIQPPGCRIHRDASALPLPSSAG